MTSRPFFRRPGVLLALALAAVAVVVSIIGKLAGGPDSSRKTTALGGDRGAEAYPAFSPDGKSLAFSLRLEKGEPYHLYIRRLPNGERRQFTNADGSDTGPAWSPDGADIAFLRVKDGHGECLVAPASGGEARKIADCGAQSDATLPAVAWMPDGKSLVVSAAREDKPPIIALVFASGGALTPITDPPAGTQGDSTPAVSPSGQTIAFARAGAAEGDDIYTCDLSGRNLQRLTFENRSIRGLAWTPDGSHLVYAAPRTGQWRLWRLPAAGGSPRDLGIPGRSAQYPAIGAEKLAYTLNPSISAIWRAPLGAGEGTEGEELVRSQGREFNPAYSPDGKFIADISDQSGFDEIWVSNSDGGDRRQITHLKDRSNPRRPRWSPDGQTLAFEASIGANTSEIDTVSVAGGEPKRILANAGNPSWSNDGKSIYFVSEGQIGKVAAKPGSERLMLSKREGANQPQESSDGKYVYYTQFGAVWRVPSGGGAEEEVVRPDRGYLLGAGRVTPKGIYYAEWIRGGRRPVGAATPKGVRFPATGTASLMFYDFDSKQSTEAFTAPTREFSGLSISPDLKYVIYPRTDDSMTTLVLVEGFR